MIQPDGVKKVTQGGLRWREPCVSNTHDEPNTRALKYQGTAKSKVENIATKRDVFISLLAVLHQHLIKTGQLLIFVLNIVLKFVVEVAYIYIMHLHDRVFTKNRNKTCISSYYGYAGKHVPDPNVFRCE